ncbi:MAG TPA: hypothetical protein VK864_04295 [Longimicrobiales bacterium]|nr:hypothetical protein [Longimicrobiales bacterium]
MSRKFVTALVGFAMVLSAAEAGAIPAFARKYRISCNLCHSPIPALTAFGETFAGNGFEVSPGEPPRDTINTGDPLLRLQQAIPFGVRIDAYVQGVSKTTGGAVQSDLQTPYSIKLLSGGQIADKVSYYFYFFLSERGEVAGLEDAYIQFTDILGSGVSVIAGQFQVSDPLFKRELRLPFEDYQLYRMRVGDVRADLTYDRGAMLLYSPWEGGDLSVQILNGRGLEPAGENRQYDSDNWKTFAARFSQDFSILRLGGFGYFGREGREGEFDNIAVYGPDLTLSLGRVQLNAQYLRRTDSDPYFLNGDDTSVDSFLAEAVWAVNGPQGKLFISGLANVLRSDEPIFSVRQGEADALDRYESGALGATYLLRRNLRLTGETQYDFQLDRVRFTAGFVTAF